MSTDQPHLIRSASLTGFADLAQSAGLAPLAMMRKAGLPRRCLDDSETLIGMEAFGLRPTTSAEKRLDKFCPTGDPCRYRNTRRRLRR